MEKKPELVNGALFTDDRGKVQSMNTLDLSVSGIRRFYVVSNHQQGFIRAFHGHMFETKYLYVLTGAISVKTTPVDFSTKVDTYNIGMGSMLVIPAGYYHGFKTLTVDTKVLVLSNSTLQESMLDDLRLPYDHFGLDIWKDNYR